MRRASSLVFVASLIAACSSGATYGPVGGGGAGGKDAGADAPADALKDAPADVPEDVNYDVPVTPPPDGSIMHPCTLPGSVQFTSGGTVTVPGGMAGWPSLAFLHLPPGFCAHYFGTVGNARQLRFASGGELFVASPTGLTTGGGANGQSAIVVLPDDNLDGVADAPVTFQNNLQNVQGMLFANDHFYYQDQTKIVRVPYATGQRMPSGPTEMVANITYYTSALHWPKPMDVADDGTIYVGNGGDQGETCLVPHPFHGGVLKIDAAPGANMGGVQVTKGFRNPISVRCVRGHNTCFALELAKDYTAGMGGREKMVPIHQGDDWGFPCCASKNLAYTDAPAGTDCSGVSAEGNSFLIGDTPFDMDFERGFWPGMWNGRAFVVTHGAAGSWTGARMVAIPMDATTGLPLPSTNTGGVDVGMVDFATGWDDKTLQHGRPAAVAFASDGRLFVANDGNGVIFWIAPM